MMEFLRSTIHFVGVRRFGETQGQNFGERQAISFMIVSRKRQNCSVLNKVRCDLELSLRRRFCGMSLLANHLQTGSGNRHCATRFSNVAGEFHLVAQVRYELCIVIRCEVACHRIDLAVRS
jgi:hypothetical protein